MNKTFKIVFNKARGALMVANEMTSSVQKKGIRTIVAGTAVALASSLACATSTTYDYEWSNSATGTNKATGYSATENKDLGADGKTVSISANAENGLAVGASNLIKGATLTIKGSQIDVTATSTGGSVYGVNGENNSIINFQDEQSGNTKVTADNSKANSPIDYAMGIYNNQSEINFYGNKTTILVKANAVKSYGVNAEANAEKTTINFNSSDTLINVSTSSGTVFGLSPSGTNAKINFNGSSAEVDTSVTDGLTVAVYSQFGGLASFKADAELKATTTGDGSAAWGIMVQDYITDDDNLGAGSVQFDNSLKITAISNGNNSGAFGIENTATKKASQDSTDDGLIKAGRTSIIAIADEQAIGINAAGVLAQVTLGDSEITVTSTSTSDSDAFTAIGISSSDGANITIGNTGNSTITATATNSNAIGIFNGATVTLNGNTTIKAIASEGGAFGIYNDSSANTILNGATTINAENAIIGKGSLTVNGDLTLNGNVSDFYGTVNIKGGTTKLTEKTGYFGGNVVVSDKGSLTASGFTLKDKQTLSVNAGGTLTSTVGTVFYEKGTTNNASLTMTGTEVELKKGFTFDTTDTTLVLTDSGTYKLALFNSMLDASQVGTLALVNAKADLSGTDNVDISKSNVILPEIQSDVPVTITGKSLTIDASSSSTAATSTVGSINLSNADSALKLTNNSDVKIESLASDGGTVNVNNNSTLNVGEFKVSGEKPSVNISGDSSLHVETLTGENAAISIGAVDGTASTAGATMTVGKLALTSGTIFVDPLYDAHASLTIDEVADNQLFVNVIAGNGSLVTIGATDATASAAVDKLGFSDRSAIVYTAKSLDLTRGSINIGSGLTIASAAAAGNVEVGQGGALIVDQAALGSSTVFSNADVTFTNDGRLGLANAVAGTLTLGKSLSGLTLDNVYTDTPFIDVAAVTDTGVTTKVSPTSGLAAIASTGLQAMTRRADSVLAQTIADRTSVDQDYATGIGLWVDVTGERYEADKLDNNGSFKSDMGYGAFGGDFAITEDISAGAAIQYGKGTVRSSVSNIKNSIDSYGITAYGSMKFGDAKVVAEASYVKNENDITSSQTALNQSVDTDIYSFGVRGQHRFTAGQFQFVPSVGVRVSRLNTDAMKVGAVKVKKQEQTLVQVPIALRVNGFEQNAGGWSLAPSVKVAYVPTFGDKEISVLGADQTVIDTAPVQGDFGIRAQKGNLMINANFMVGGGKDGTSSVGGKAGLKYVF